MAITAAPKQPASTPQDPFSALAMGVMQETVFCVSVPLFQKS